MSINKVLNRPMFRQQALKRGHLKPIHAQTGVMVGGAPTQNITATQYRPPMVIDQPTLGQKFKTGVSRFVSDVKNFPKSLPGQIKSPTTRVPYGLGGGIGRLLGVEGIYSGVSNATTKLGMQPGMLKNIADFGATGLLALNPYARAAGLGYSAFRMARPIVGGAVDYLTQKPAGTTAKALTVDMGEPIAPELFKPIDPAAPKNNRRRIQNQERTKKALEKKGIKSPTAAEIAQVEETGFKVSPRRKQVLKRMEQKDLLTQADNETKLGNNTVVDSNKVATNTAGLNEVPAPDLQFDEGDMKMPPLKDVSPKDDADDKKNPNKNIILNTGQTGAGSGTGKMTDGEGKKITDDTIARAKQIRDELMAGKSSQAGLVFLANLASGLLSGTTAKAGIGGALEVLGKALGPAVNNYATIKLKEDELSNEFMESALELASDEIAAKNDAVEYEYPERTPGVIQEIGPKGVIKNYVGALMKDGTMLIRVPGALDQNGRQVYRPYTGTGRFKDMDFVNDKTTEIAHDIDGILRSVSTADKSLKILEEAYKKDKSFGGLVGQLRITTERVTDALGDLTSFGNRVDFGDQYELLLDKNAKALVEGGEFKDEESAKKYLKEELGRIDANGKALTGDGQSFVDENLSKFLGDDRTSDAQNLERLAVNETILVYALANALKSKDRLTQKDIQNAKELVKVFSLGRGSKTTIRSLRALREILVDKYSSQERLYRQAGGDEGTLENFKSAYKIIPGTATSEQGRIFGDLNQSDILNEIGDLPK